MRQFVREYCVNQAPPRPKLAHKFERLLDRLVHWVRHVRANGVQHQVIEPREPKVSMFREGC